MRALAAESAGAPHWSGEAWARLIDPPQGLARESLLLVARAPDQPVGGWLAATLLGDVTELEFVLVGPMHQGMGLGSALLRHWLLWARARGATQGQLEVRASNEVARRLYRRLGFAEASVRRSYYTGPVEDAILMSASLHRDSVPGSPQPG